VVCHRAMRGLCIVAGRSAVVAGAGDVTTLAAACRAARGRVVTCRAWVSAGTLAGLRRRGVSAGRAALICDLAEAHTLAGSAVNLAS
jgi:hypothetical protein